MQYKHTIVSEDPADFLLTCKAHELCFRCEGKVEDGLPLGAVHQHKNVTTITGGPLCSDCSVAFVLWLSESNK